MRLFVAHAAYMLVWPVKNVAVDVDVVVVTVYYAEELVTGFLDLREASKSRKSAKPRTVLVVVVGIVLVEVTVVEVLGFRKSVIVTVTVDVSVSVTSGLAVMVVTGAVFVIVTTVYFSSIS